MADLALDGVLCIDGEKGSTMPLFCLTTRRALLVGVRGPWQPGIIPLRVLYLPGCNGSPQQGVPVASRELTIL